MSVGVGVLVLVLSFVYFVAWSAEREAYNLRCFTPMELLRLHMMCVLTRKSLLQDTVPTEEYLQ